MNKPNGLNEINATYGDPRGRNETERYNKDWAKKNLIVIESPYYLVIPWNDIITNKIQCHKLIAKATLEVLTDLVNTFGVQLLVENKLNKYGGCFCFRGKTGNKNELSVHSWGIAYDFLFAGSAYGCTEPLGKMETLFCNVWKKHGWTWGGDWKTPDRMHFQLCDGY